MNVRDLSGQWRFLRENARWLASGFLLTVFSSFGQAYFLSLFSEAIREELSLGNGEFGAVFMSSTLASAVSLWLLGPLVDRLPVRGLALGACIALSLACMMMTQLASVWMLVITLYLLRLLGQGLLPHIAMVCMARWFVGERGRAVAVSALGHQTGVALLPLAVVGLLAVADWQWVWLIGSLSLLLLAAPLSWWLMQHERIPRQAIRPAAETEQEHHWTRNEVARDPAYWIGLLFLLTPAFAGTSVIFHLMHVVDVKGWSATDLALGMSLMSLGNIIALLVSGVWVDHRGSVSLLGVFLVPFALSFAVLGLSTQVWGLFLFMFLLGATQGLFTTLLGSLYPALYGVRYLGAIRAQLMTAIVVATAVGPGLSGWLLDAGVSVNHLLLAVCAYALIGVVVLSVLSVHLRDRLAGNVARRHV